MTAVAAWAIVDKDGWVMRIGMGPDCPAVEVCDFDRYNPTGAPHTAVKGEWRPTNDLAR